MADKTINTLDTELTTVGANDLIGVWDVAAAQYKKAKRSNVVGATITGGGTIAMGGFTFTVPATGTAALLGRTQTFTGANTIDASAGSDVALTVVPRNGATPYGLLFSSPDNGANAGPSMRIGRNSNASTPAAGSLELYSRNNTGIIWVDGSGNLRIGTTLPTNATDTGGTVVGAQTSMAEAKYLADDVTPISEVLASIQQAATEAVKMFTYRSGAFNSQAFEGVVTDLAPRYGMDRDEAHPAGKSLNEITLLGDLLRAVAWLSERVAILEAK
jgi:hypothetical protein